MTKKHALILILAVLTALVLCACGATAETSSDPEGLLTFGMDVNPSAQPSTAQTAPDNNTPAVPGASLPPGATGAANEGNSAAVVATSDAPVEPSPAASSAASAAPTASNSGSASPSPTRRPSEGNTPVSASPSPSPSVSPAISPPLPASTATIDQAQSYIGKSLSTLIAELGYPSSSDYEDVDEGNPDTDRIGTLYFDGFVVTTLRTSSGETVTGVTAGSVRPSASNSGAAEENADVTDNDNTDNDDTDNEAEGDASGTDDSGTEE